MLSYSNIAPKHIIVLDGEPYEVASTSGVVKKQRQKPHNTAKLRNLKTGSIVERTFTQADKIEEADVVTKKVTFIYTRPEKDEWWFHEAGNPAKRFSIGARVIGDAAKFLAPNTDVDTLWFEDSLIQVRLPIKMNLKVKEAPPNVKGNTAQGGVKPVVLETGASVNVPMFINAGDVVRINTETGTYVERA
ncbi:elongation factor P [Candidatus Kaiserbacteria bacterium CG10_big_fil_rev_8_21_14_0_10_59_10]|uniref:Elongation factor P n=1 Tax=Candidatus Kaiserbacteria bacterium CG10_big_fil_rev_8_21_14_0_10_59_10 TaxID=1974612 RepID=A0A2H0U8I8_9BACT|nr:MAG: elongation factor P [Candidatus Kaiserbacteria bacterium CG10_big_fil_rev_8_21_14_0_10_59_10]